MLKRPRYARGHGRRRPGDVVSTSIAAPVRRHGCVKRDFSSGPLLRSGSRERRREFPVQKRAVCFTYHAIKTPCHVVFQALAVVPRLSWRPCLLSWRCSSQQLCCTWARARARACAHTLARATRTSNTDSLERQRKAETDHSWRLRAVAILGPSGFVRK